MWRQEMKKYLGLFVVGAILIALYKTFDNFSAILDWGRNLLSLLTPVVIGGCVAYVLYIPCRKLETIFDKTKLKWVKTHQSGLAIASVYLLFLLVVVLLFFAIIPILTRNITDFIEQLPSLIQNFFQWLNSFGVYEFSSESLMRFLNENLLSLDKLLGGISFDNVNRYARSVMNVGTTIFDIIIGVVISIYVLIDRKSLKQIFLRFFHAFGSKKYCETVVWYGRKINEFIRLYISCQLLDAVIVFGLSLIVLSILRVRYAVLLALIIGTFNLIPYFGAIVATLLAALITIFTKDFMSGLIVAAVLIVIQQLDANFIQPRLLSQSLEVRPFWVVVGILLGGGLFGVLGVFLAVPIFALLRIILLDVLRHRERKVLVGADPKKKKTE